MHTRGYPVQRYDGLTSVHFQQEGVSLLSGTIIINKRLEKKCFFGTEQKFNNVSFGL
jgi:hypothetical protein